MLVKLTTGKRFELIRLRLLKILSSIITPELSRFLTAEVPLLSGTTLKAYGQVYIQFSE